MHSPRLKVNRCRLHKIHIRPSGYDPRSFSLIARCSKAKTKVRSSPVDLFLPSFAHHCLPPLSFFFLSSSSLAVHHPPLTQSPLLIHNHHRLLTMLDPIDPTEPAPWDIIRVSMVIGPVTGYFHQYYTMYKMKTSMGFSSVTCGVLIVSRYLSPLLYLCSFCHFCSCSIALSFQMTNQGLFLCVFFFAISIIRIFFW